MDEDMEDRRKMKMFPILHSYRVGEEISRIQEGGWFYLVVSVPWDMIAPHEKQAMKNHSQTLQRLADRGGLGAEEALAVLQGKSYYDIPYHGAAEAHKALFNAVESWMRTPRSEASGIPPHKRDDE